ncbi:CPBP family intramembrane glutamic endopeptidase [Filibacter tadaridae]|uniref:CAAX amino terminal protease self- immunity n=1 Tax=Filibacter tadaridae TaxID=2483811 RepID=A0A3P5X364_9BACL|nr:CPBP family intramembrane glutamic endopeptidase [Filibacter tadaridae]VDC25661.1 CAAX amino terminal protease self- immunity [Filibacter tadaridae]
MKNWKIYIYLLLTYIVMQVSSVYLVKVLISYFKGKEGMTAELATYNGFAWTLFIVNTLAAIVFLAFIIPNKKFFTVFKGKKASIGKTVLWGFLGFFLAMGGQMLAAGIETLLGIELGSENTAVLSEVAKFSPIVIISMVIFAPFLEEIIFRRVIFGGIYMKTNVWIAAIVSALIFAAVHNEFQHILMYMAPAFVFAYVYYHTKRLWAPMISHMLMNGFVVIVQLNADKILKLQEMKQAIIVFFQ